MFFTSARLLNAFLGWALDITSLSFLQSPSDYTPFAAQTLMSHDAPVVIVAFHSLFTHCSSLGLGYCCGPYCSVNNRPVLFRYEFVEQFSSYRTVEWYDELNVLVYQESFTDISILANLSMPCDLQGWNIYYKTDN